MSFFNPKDCAAASMRDLFEKRLNDAKKILEINYIRDEKLDGNIDSIVILLTKNQKLSDLHIPITNENITFLEGFLKDEDFSGKKDEVAYLTLSNNGKYIGCLVFGLGDLESLDLPYFELTGKKIYNILNSKKRKEAGLFFDVAEYNKDLALKIPFGASLNKYRFDLKTENANKKNKDKNKNSKHDGLKKLDVFVPNEILNDSDLTTLKGGVKEIESLVRSINVTKTYCDGPANLIYPESFANYVKDDLKDLGVKIEVFDKNQITSLGMGALLGVAQASVNEPRFVVLKYNGGSSDTSPLLFVGKGVTFDSGGLSLKPADSMEGMKYDMSGAATVAGLVRALAERKAKVNVVGIMAIVENSVSGNAQRPGDVVMSMSGQTIEVLNTDAEGRLILADALTYGQTKLTPKPRIVIDLATLTGAAIVALGTNTYGALLSNNDEVVGQLLESGRRINETLWRLPLREDYDRKMDSKIADMQNISNSRGFGAGTITAAEFLQRFIEDDTIWAHLDIAGVDNRSSGNDTEISGSAAFGVKLLNDFVKNYEK